MSACEHTLIYAAQEEPAGARSVPELKMIINLIGGGVFRAALPLWCT